MSDGTMLLRSARAHSKFYLVVGLKNVEIAMLLSSLSKYF